MNLEEMPPPAAPRRHGRKARILVIDDERALRELSILLLSHAGHTVFTAANGREGLAWLEKNSADLVITDVLMPEQDGLETMREIHRRWSRLPLVAFTGGGKLPAEYYLRLAKAFGARSVLTKPFAAKELYAAVDEALATGETAG